MVAGSLNLKNDLVRNFIEANYGKDSYSILLTLDKRGKTDEEISKKVKLKVNEIRSHLNQLNYAGIIYYTKEKSPTSNWYTYTWFVKKERVWELIRDRYKEELEELKKKLDYENTYTFFKCVKGCTKLPFELAYEYDFKCPECGSEMKSYNNSRDKKKLADEINKIEKFLKEEEQREQLRKEKAKKAREKEEVLRKEEEKEAKKKTGKIKKKKNKKVVVKEKKAKSKKKTDAKETKRKEVKKKEVKKRAKKKLVKKVKKIKRKNKKPKKVKGAKKKVARKSPAKKVKSKKKVKMSSKKRIVKKKKK